MDTALGDGIVDLLACSVMSVCSIFAIPSLRSFFQGR
jgi:hypothetical protein